MILSLDQQWLEAFGRGDTDLMSKIEAPDIIVITGEGLLEPPGARPRDLSAIRARRERTQGTGVLSLTTRHLEGARVRFYGEVAILTGLQERLVQDSTGNTQTQHRYYTSVWVRNSGSSPSWRVVSAQWTPPVTASKS